MRLSDLPPASTGLHQPTIFKTPVPRSTTSGWLHPTVRASMEEMFDGPSTPTPTDGLRQLVREFATSDDPAERRQSLYYQMWQCEGLDFGFEPKRWEELSKEVTEVEPDCRLEPLGELMISGLLSDGWLRRAYFRRSAEALATSLSVARIMGASAIQTSVTASLGVVVTLGGYVAEGLGVITRSAAHSVDCADHSCIGTSGHPKQERHQVIELADADEHSRNFRRAVVGYQLATSLLGPAEVRTRSCIYLALVRCLCRIGKSEMAAEIFRDIEALPDLSKPAVRMKLARTKTALLAVDGRVADALDHCSAELTPELRTNTIGMYLELLVDGMSIARQADEPKWVVAHAGDDALHTADGVGLAATFAYDDLAWAYRRLGDRSSAGRCQYLARLGRHRFGARSGHSPFSTGSAPGVLRSARELHQRALRARESERVSLARGIGSVAHDVRGQLQSLQFMAERDDLPELGVDPVRSIVTAIDDILSGLLREIEAEREIALSEVCLTSVVSAVIARFQSAALHKRISISSNLRDPIGCLSDRVALDRIVSNLVSNAIKYSPVGGWVHVTTTALADSVIDLHIIDSGPGVPSDEIDELFRWGGTLSSEPTAGETQHGIGLFTVQRLARLTGATIQPHPRGLDDPSTMSVRLHRAR